MHLYYSVFQRGIWLAFHQQRVMAVSFGAVLSSSEDPALNLGQAPGLWSTSGAVIVSVHKRGRKYDYEFRLAIIIFYVWLKPHGQH